MSHHEYSQSGGAGGFDVAKAIFSQADTNQDGAIDRNEFQSWAGGAGTGAGQFGAGHSHGGAGHFGAGAGGAGGGFESSSYESSNYSSAGGAAGGFGGGAGGGFGGGAGLHSDADHHGGGQHTDADHHGGADHSDAEHHAGGFHTDADHHGGAVGGGGFESSSSFESTSQAAGYTAETNAAWSRYGAEVRGAGLYFDANPQIIRRQAAGGVQTYTQNIKVRFLQPPPIPPPGVSHISHCFCLTIIIFS
jgi:hypothetical protein